MGLKHLPGLMTKVLASQEFRNVRPPLPAHSGARQWVSGGKRRRSTVLSREVEGGAAWLHVYSYAGSSLSCSLAVMF